jgi:hypothetical protein
MGKRDKHRELGGDGIHSLSYLLLLLQLSHAVRSYPNLFYLAARAGVAQVLSRSITMARHEKIFDERDKW